MIKEIKNLTDLILNPLNLKISDIILDTESEEYSGFNFKINQTNIKFRKSKLTPKKVGQFVALWKRDSDGKTIPLDINDDFEFYIIDVEESDNHGFFIFPKVVLENKQILSNQSKNGKRGFRIYADWHFPNNKQADKTKLWQNYYFINLSDKESKILEKFETIFNSKTQ